eukprot:6568206-Alexandrium_andersonii.AAC.1
MNSSLCCRCSDSSPSGGAGFLEACSQSFPTRTSRSPSAPRLTEEPNTDWKRSSAPAAEDPMGSLTAGGRS